MYTDRDIANLEDEARRALNDYLELAPEAPTWERDALGATLLRAVDALCGALRELRQAKDPD